MRGLPPRRRPCYTRRPTNEGEAVRYDNIQVLRVAAAVGVVFFHLGCVARSHAGVDLSQFLHPLLAGFPVPLFFAVSGFVLTHALRSAPPGRFLFARFLRLYPGYWLAALGALALMRVRAFTEHDRWMIYFVNLNTVTLWPAGPGRALYVLGVEWSLVYEVFLSVALVGLSLFGLRRLPVLAGLWLTAVLVKVLAWPGFASDQFPRWTTIALSAFNVPFILGVLAYFVRERGRRWRWAVLPLVAAGLVGVSQWQLTQEQFWCGWGVGAAGVVWLAVQFRQVSKDNRLARAGDWTYGLYLVHVPLMLVVLNAAARNGWVGRMEVMWATGLVALVGGFLFGVVECRLHARLRPLAKLRLPRLPLGRLRVRAPGHQPDA